MVTSKEALPSCSKLENKTKHNKICISAHLADVLCAFLRRGQQMWGQHRGAKQGRGASALAVNQGCQLWAVKQRQMTIKTVPLPGFWGRKTSRWCLSLSGVGLRAGHGPVQGAMCSHPEHHWQPVGEEEETASFSVELRGRFVQQHPREVVAELPCRARPHIVWAALRTLF